jgi:formylmethanofuran dehydrogenase subunit E
MGTCFLEKYLNSEYDEKIGPYKTHKGGIIMKMSRVKISGFISTIILSAILVINIPVASSTPPDAETTGFLEKFHGHVCPGSLMGLRLAIAAKEALKAEGKIEAKTFLLACSVDGIQVGAGTTYGNRALTVEDKKDMSLILTDTKSGRQVEARLTEEAMEKGKGFRELSAKSRSFTEGSPEQVAAKKEIDDILNWYKTAPDEKVVIIKVLK